MGPQSAHRFRSRKGNIIDLYVTISKFFLCKSGGHFSIVIGAIFRLSFNTDCPLVDTHGTFSKEDPDVWRRSSQKNYMFEHRLDLSPQKYFLLRNLRKPERVIKLKFPADISHRLRVDYPECMIIQL